MELIFDDRWLQVTDNTDHHAYAPQTANSKCCIVKWSDFQIEIFRPATLSNVNFGIHISGTYK